jgi:modified peptide precursor CbpA
MVAPIGHQESCAALQLDFAKKGGDLMKTTKKPSIIATRKGCDVNGTGLSHYVMMDAKK